MKIVDLNNCLTINQSADKLYRLLVDVTSHVKFHPYIQAVTFKEKKANKEVYQIKDKLKIWKIVPYSHTYEAILIPFPKQNKFSFEVEESFHSKLNSEFIFEELNNKKTNVCIKVHIEAAEFLAPYMAKMANLAHKSFLVNLQKEFMS